MARRSGTISASEVGQYTYCRRAWWLARVQGSIPTNQEALANGTMSHRQHGRGVRLAQIGQVAAYILLGAGGLTLLIMAIQWLLRGVA